MKTDFFKAAHRKTFKEATRIPTADETLQRMWKQVLTGRQVELGIGQEGLFTVPQASRIHTHIIGEPGMGKSRLIEYLARWCIKHKTGLLLLDPSKGGRTAYDVLRYCASKNLKKVILIDTHHIKTFNKVLGLNPFIYEKNWVSECVVLVQDAIEVLYEQKDLSSTPNIKKYLKALLNVLIQAGKTPYDARAFFDDTYFDQREQILDKSELNDYFRRSIEDALYDQRYQSEIRTTGRRLDDIFSPPLSLMVSKNGPDFMRLVADGWIILVNLDAVGLNKTEKKLLATLLINMCTLAANRLTSAKFDDDHHPWTGEFHLFLDEAGDYGNAKLIETMAKGRKTGLRVTVAHQWFKQFHDPSILEGIRGSAGLKLAFKLANSHDRMEIVKDMYGGALSDREVAYNISKLQRRELVAKFEGEDAAIIKTLDVPDVKMSNSDLDSYIEQIYKQPFYYSATVVKHEHNHLYPKRTNTVLPGTAAKPVHGKPPQTHSGKGEHTPKSTEPAKTKGRDRQRPTRSADEIFMAPAGAEKTELPPKKS
jgi:hypothetical protein